MYYHLSSNLDEEIEVFSPRIPKREKRMDGENDFIPRICLGKTIEDCLSGMPEGGYKLKTEEGENALTFRVYAFKEEDINKENLIDPTSLYFSNWVLDSWVTGEHWVVDQELVPLEVFDIELKDFEVTDAPFVSPDVFKEAFKEKGDPLSILERLEDDSKESVARVTNLNYRVINS